MARDFEYLRPFIFGRQKIRILQCDKYELCCADVKSSCSRSIAGDADMGRQQAGAEV